MSTYVGPLEESWDSEGLTPKSAIDWDTKAFPRAGESELNEPPIGERISAVEPLILLKMYPPGLFTSELRTN